MLVVFPQISNFGGSRSIKMPNGYFQFKQFTVHQDRCAMKVTTDASLFGAWIAHQIENEKTELSTALDIGTGSGLLSLMVAQKTELQIDTIEIDNGAFQQAENNIAASAWKGRITSFHGDVRNFEFKKKYDVIFSNPPFYENELKSDDSKRNIALHGSELSFDDLLRLIEYNLSPEGFFFLLLPYKRKDEIRPLFKDHDLDIVHITFVRQSVTHDYFRIMLKGKIKTKKHSEFFFDELSIWNEKKQYTEPFRNLLREYYLYL